MVGKVFGAGGREGKGMGDALTEYLVSEVCSGSEGGVIQAYVG